MAIIIDNDSRFDNTIVTVHVHPDTEMTEAAWTALLDALAPVDGSDKAPTHLDVEVSSINGNPLFFRAEAQFGAFDQPGPWDQGYIRF